MQSNLSPLTLVTQYNTFLLDKTLFNNIYSLKNEVITMGFIKNAQHINMITVGYSRTFESCHVNGVTTGYKTLNESTQCCLLHYCYSNVVNLSMHRERFSVASVTVT